MQQILLLTDFSNNANKAMDYAFELFKNEHINFYILYVHKASKYTTSELITSTPGASVYDAIIKDPKASLEKLIDVYKEKYKDQSYTFKSIVDHDVFINAVNQTVNSKKIDLIIMGTNGATGASEIVFGSNTIHVIRQVKCPVIAVPEGYTFTVPNTVLFSLDQDVVFNESTLNSLKHFIDKFNLEIHVLILEKDIAPERSIELKNTIQQVFKGFSLNFYIIESVPTDIAIDSFVQIKDVDISAKIINKSSFLKRLIKGSKTNEITYKTRVPLLMMQP